MAKWHPAMYIADPSTQENPIIDAIKSCVTCSSTDNNETELAGSSTSSNT